MRTDHPATALWLDQTAQRCANALQLGEQQRDALRALLDEAVVEFPDAAIAADMMTSVHGVLARDRRRSMSAASWELWRKAVRLYRRTNRQVLAAPGAARDEWQSAGQAWFECVSGTTLNQPVRLVKKQGRPRDMVVSAVQVMCDRDETEGFAVLEAVVYRPPRTSSCQVFTPGDELHRLEWADLPPRARPGQLNQ